MAVENSKSTEFKIANLFKIDYNENIVALYGVMFLVRRLNLEEIDKLGAFSP